MHTNKVVPRNTNQIVIPTLEGKDGYNVVFIGDHPTNKDGIFYFKIVCQIISETSGKIIVTDSKERIDKEYPILNTEESINRTVKLIFDEIIKNMGLISNKTIYSPFMSWKKSKLSSELCCEHYYLQSANGSGNWDQNFVEKFFHLFPKILLLNGNIIENKN